MYEVNFDEIINIEKDIKNIKNPKKSNLIIKVLATNIVIIVSSCILAKFIPVGTLLEKGMFVLISSLIGTGTYMAIDIFETIMNNIKKNKAKNQLRNVTNVLSQNKIDTNIKELTNSVIINNNKKVIIETSEDEIKNINIEEVNDKYCLFLDNDSQIQGILQRKTKTKNNEAISEDNNYYVLEELDLESFYPKVTEVKKLVKKK